MFTYFTLGGPLMYPILLASVGALAIMLYKWRQYSAALKDLHHSHQELQDYPPAMLKPIAKGFAQNLSEKEIGMLGAREVRRLEKGLYTLSVLAVITPLLGLTGTVTGMIQVFQTVSAAGPRLEPALLAGGIWEALITTAAGLFVAIPAHLGHHFLEEMLEKIAFEIRAFAISLQAGRQQ